MSENLNTIPDSRLFAALTCNEADVLGASLHSGQTKVSKVTGRYDLSEEIHDIMADLREARRQRWNTEHPDFTYEFSQ
jgi:hypothetical protein